MNALAPRAAGRPDLPRRFGRFAARPRRRLARRGGRRGRLAGERVVALFRRPLPGAGRARGVRPRRLRARPRPAPRGRETATPTPARCSRDGSTYLELEPGRAAPRTITEPARTSPSSRGRRADPFRCTDLRRRDVDLPRLARRPLGPVSTATAGPSSRSPRPCARRPGRDGGALRRSPPGHVRAPARRRRSSMRPRARDGALRRVRRADGHPPRRGPALAPALRGRPRREARGRARELVRWVEYRTDAVADFYQPRLLLFPTKAELERAARRARGARRVGAAPRAEGPRARRPRRCSARSRATASRSSAASRTATWGRSPGARPGETMTALAMVVGSAPPPATTARSPGSSAR